MLTSYQRPSNIHVLPTTLGETIEATAQALQEAGEQMAPATALYCEKAQGFQCASCAYVRAVNATHGKCLIVAGIVHLEEGCCAMWEPDTQQLHLYRQPQHESY